MKVGCTAATGVAGPEDLLAGFNLLAELYGHVGAVAVAPSCSRFVNDRESFSARFAVAATLFAAAHGPPVVRPLVNGCDGAAADGVDRGVGRDQPVPGGVVVVGGVDGVGLLFEELSGYGQRPVALGGRGA